MWGGKKDSLNQLGHCVSNKKKGRLGIKNLSVINTALLGKWGWRFAISENSIWKEIISLKYKMEDPGWFTKIPTGSHGVGLWKAICKEAYHLRKNYSLALGNGRMIKI